MILRWLCLILLSPLTAEMQTGWIEVCSGKGQLFYTAYTKDEPNRPITFCFNGGPGSSSLWLHLYALGPQRMAHPHELVSTAAPYHWVENKNSIFDLTDLVFIDPIGTGYSRTAEGVDPAQFWRVDEDIECFADFIHNYLSLHQRWLCPKFLAGESYGTTRAAGLAAALQEERGIFLNGLILISPCIDFSSIDLSIFEMGNDSFSPPALLLPSLAATAWHWGLLSHDRSLYETVAEAREFAETDYLCALLQGAEGASEICEKVAHFSGLPYALVHALQGRIPLDFYRRALLSPKQCILNVHDSRLVGPPTTLGAAVATGNAYFHQRAPYIDFSDQAAAHWKWPSFQTPNFLAPLRRGLLLNPDLHLFVGCGYFDLVTPFAAAEASFKQLKLPLENRLEYHLYEAGHAFYLTAGIHDQFKQDLTTFYKNALTPIVAK